MFKVLDILVISNKYVDELRALPDEKLSAMSSLVKVSQHQCGAAAIADWNWVLYRLRWVNIPP